MGVLADAAEILDARRLGDASPDAIPGRDPQAVAFSRRADRGAVMFLLRRTTGDWMAIVVLLERDGVSWYEVALAHQASWDPAEPFGEDELMRSSGHSRFMSGPAPEAVLIPGQAAPGARVLRTGNAAEEIVVHPPWGHFLYFGEIERSDESVALTARRAGAEETVVFDPIGHR